MNYERVNWQDGKDGNTKVDATNLNKMDEAIKYLFDNSSGGSDITIEQEVTNSTENVPCSNAVLTALNNLKGTILWTNPDPTSNFGKQTINLSSDDYDLLEIFFYDNVGRKYCDSVRTLKGENTLLHYNWSGSGNTTTMRMLDYVSDTSYSVNNGYRSGTTDDSMCVPIYIIGYKTGIFN